MNLDWIAPAIKRASGWLIAWSIVSFVCGILAIFLPLTFSFAIAVVIGLVVMFGGIAHLVFGIQTRHLGGFFGHMLLFALYEVAAILLLANPLLSIFSLAFMLATFLLLEGLLEIALYLGLKQ